MMDAAELKIAEGSGTLLEPNLHDGYLLGIHLPAKDSVELTVEELGGKRYRISLEGVSQFCAMDFRQGNIILDVTVFRGEEVPLCTLDPLDLPEYQEKLHEIVVRESLYVLNLNPSYGCWLVGVARKIRLESVE